MRLSVSSPPLTLEARVLEEAEWPSVWALVGELVGPAFSRLPSGARPALLVSLEWLQPQAAAALED